MSEFDAVLGSSLSIWSIRISEKFDLNMVITDTARECLSVTAILCCRDKRLGLDLQHSWSRFKVFQEVFST